MDKGQLRTKMLNIRNSMPTEERTEKSAKIRKKIEEHEDFINADHILFYYTHESEVDMIPLINKYANLKTIYLPKLINENEFVALPFHQFNTLKKGIYNIPEPIQKKECSYEKKLDLIIVPGVAFDPEGNRIGMGKGFYDRYLKELSHVPKIAPAFGQQMLDHIPKDPYDVPVDVIITDENTYTVTS